MERCDCNVGCLKSTNNLNEANHQCMITSRPLPDKFKSLHMMVSETVWYDNSRVHQHMADLALENFQ